MLKVGEKWKTKKTEKFNTKQRIEYDDDVTLLLSGKAFIVFAKLSAFVIKIYLLISKFMRSFTLLRVWAVALNIKYLFMNS